MAKFSNVEVDGIKCQIYKIPLLDFADMDRDVMTIAGPILASLSGMDKATEVTQALIIPKVTAALGAMDKSTYNLLLEKLLSCVNATAPGKPPLMMTRANIDTVMEDFGMVTLYKIIWEVLRFNKATPFEVLGGLKSLTGTGIPATNG